MKILLLLLVIPLIELYVLIQVGGVIGALPTVLLTIATAIVGLALMRSQGLATMQSAQLEMAQGRSPEASMFEGVFIFLGGVFLFFPGLISDTLGFLLLIPLVRRFLIKQTTKGFASRTRYRYETNDQVFEGEWEEKKSAENKTIHHHKD